ncbi:WHG domain-containing protein [Nocardia sp. NPDC046473]|uniref:TetR/AcrR family transcriptional regulator n=1 Tax=Nocardia sp. NPDC046473 TaxID=3155733 RepID=UPI0033DF7327
MASSSVQREHYHHGDLHNALVAAAVALARDGGPQAVVLREVARQVGVSATSAYRHFANHLDLLAAVKAHAQQALTAAMRAEQVPGHVDGGAPGDQSLARLHALGRGYLRFAETEPGWFRAAFDQHTPTAAGSESFRLLSEALDELVRSGRMPAARRPGAELSVWVTVHGLAEFLLDGGPLSGLADVERENTITRTQLFITDALTG